ncbi:DUF5337 domain-containing protein [Rubellimicrobium sp. CFH 75288]|uniref:DUF5337 domain-containing protein n=1 Tax=Rubellimicrobium sp. CFH 75288 TaxID=2697034 RepID=UPI0014122904|nr:DUF5337 domain-containing protein [Rubellimicrobium sp. CFH 75288]NAZ35810.1 hypothetical protein [Rubellimicrobium sp. CFH 75288]
MAVRPRRNAPRSVPPPAPPHRPPTEADRRQARAGRTAALALAGTGLFWIAATWAGNLWDWPLRWRALCDLAALAGFAFSLYLTGRAWRLRRNQRG